MVTPGRPSRNTWPNSLPPIAHPGPTMAAPLKTGAADLLADEEQKRRPADLANRKLAADRLVG